jgi:dihydroflavonol-4-reductase
MILVTGGTGFIGSYLLYSLVNDGCEVKALYRESSSFAMTKRIFGYMSDVPEKLFAQIQWVKGDLLDIHSLSEALQGIDEVYHCAAIISFDPREREKMIRSNIDGTSNLVNACLVSGVRKFCHVSSIAALGRAEKDGLIDEQTQWKPSRHNSGYAISKYGAEREVWRGAAEGLQVVIVNPSIILGAGKPSQSSVRFLIVLRKYSRFYTNGINGYVDVRDVVKIMRILMESSITNKRFVLNSQNLTYRELISHIAMECDRTLPKIRIPRIALSLAWRLEKLRSMFTGNRPLVTRETARTSLNNNRYSSAEVIKELTIEFIPIRQTISDIFGLMNKHKR